MNKNYKSICALLSIESIALTDGKASLTDEQLTALDKAIEMKLQVISDLEAQIAALKAAPAATSTAVDVAKEILFSLDPRLRSQDLYL